MFRHFFYFSSDQDSNSGPKKPDSKSASSDSAASGDYGHEDREISEEELEKLFDEALKIDVDDENEDDLKAKDALLKNNFIPGIEMERAATSLDVLSSRSPKDSSEEEIEEPELLNDGSESEELGGTQWKNDEADSEEDESSDETQYFPENRNEEFSETEDVNPDSTEESESDDEGYDRKPEDIEDLEDENASLEVNGEDQSVQESSSDSMDDSQSDELTETFVSRAESLGINIERRVAKEIIVEASNKLEETGSVEYISLPGRSPVFAVDHEHASAEVRALADTLDAAVFTHRKVDSEDPVAESMVLEGICDSRAYPAKWMEMHEFDRVPEKYVEFHFILAKKGSGKERYYSQLAVENKSEIEELSESSQPAEMSSKEEEPQTQEQESSEIRRSSALHGKTRGRSKRMLAAFTGVAIVAAVAVFTVSRTKETQETIKKVEKQLEGPAEGMTVVSVDELMALKEERDSLRRELENSSKDQNEQIRLESLRIEQELDVKYKTKLEEEVKKSYQKGYEESAEGLSRLSGLTATYAVVHGSCRAFGASNHYNKVRMVGNVVDVLSWHVSPSNLKIEGVIAQSKELLDLGVVQVHCIIGESEIFPSREKPSIGSDGLARANNPNLPTTKAEPKEEVKE